MTTRRQLDPFVKATRRADALFPLVSLVPKAHWDTQHPEFKRYDVVLRKKTLGEVSQGQEHMYRKAGRLITRSWYRTSWYNQPSLQLYVVGVHPPWGTIYVQSRKRAVWDLLYGLLLRNIIH